MPNDNGNGRKWLSLRIGPVVVPTAVLLAVIGWLLTMTRMTTRAEERNESAHKTMQSGIVSAVARLNDHEVRIRCTESDLKDVREEAKVGLQELRGSVDVMNAKLDGIKDLLEELTD